MAKIKHAKIINMKISQHENFSIYGICNNNIIKDNDFLFLLLRVSCYYVIIRQVQYDDYYFACKQSTWLKPGTLALIIRCAPRVHLVAFLCDF